MFAIMQNKSSIYGSLLDSYALSLWGISSFTLTVYLTTFLQLPNSLLVKGSCLNLQILILIPLAFLSPR